MNRTLNMLAAVLAVFIMLSGCSGKDKEAAHDESAAPGQAAEGGGAVTAVGAELDESVLERVRAYAEDGLTPLKGYDENGEQVDYPGVTFDVQSDAKATEAIRTVRALGSELEGTGYEAYVVEMAYGMGLDRVAVLKTDDRFAILDVMQTGGYNYDIFPKDVRARLRGWDEQFGIYLLGAGPDWAHMEFVGTPADMYAFAKEVYDFCPDIVGQGTGSVESLAKEMSDTNTLFLWWD